MDSCLENEMGAGVSTFIFGLTTLWHAAKTQNFNSFKLTRKLAQQQRNDF